MTIIIPKYTQFTTFKTQLTFYLQTLNSYPDLLKSEGIRNRDRWIWA